MRQFDFSGIKTGLVIRNDDPLKRQRIGVWIPELQPDEGGTDEKESQDTSSASVFHKDSDSRPSGNSTHINFTWVESCAKIDAGADEEIASGLHSVPRKGTWVPVFFQDEDPQKPRYFPMFGTSTRDEIIGLKNASESADRGTLNDPEKRANIFAIEFPNGSIFLVDYNEEANSMILRMDDGHSFKMVKNEEEDLIEVVTPKNNRLLLDDKNKRVKLSSEYGSKIDMEDKDQKMTISTPGGREIKFNDQEKKMEIIDPDEQSFQTKEFLVAAQNVMITCETAMITCSGAGMIKASPLMIN